MPKRKNPEGGNLFGGMFAPYSPERKGDLLEYLRSCIENNADNMFLGPEYFSKMVELKLVSPGSTYVRVDLSPAPDALYFVNNQFLLESYGQGEYNMSAVSAKAGVYDPKKILKNKIWSVSGLSLYKREE